MVYYIPNFEIAPERSGAMQRRHNYGGANRTQK